MKVVSFEVKVGIFILIGIIILIIMILSIGEIYVFSPGYRIKVLFTFANGIAMNAPVRLAGVEVGEVDNIRIYHDEADRKTKVEITAWIRKNIDIESDARAVINTLGLLGEKYLEIFPGASKETLRNGGTIVGIDPISTENMTMELKEIIDSARVVVDRLRDGEGTIGRLLTDDSIYDNMEAFTEDIKKNPWKLMNKPK